MTEEMRCLKRDESEAGGAWRAMPSADPDGRSDSPGVDAGDDGVLLGACTTGVAARCCELIFGANFIRCWCCVKSADLGRESPFFSIDLDSYIASV